MMNLASRGRHARPALSLITAAAILAPGLLVGCSRTDREAKMGAEDANAANVTVVIGSSLGEFKIELWPSKAPKTVRNFLAYVDEGYYNGTIFHRVIANFMIQGGGFTADMDQKSTRDPVENEARADTPNVRGTLAMARTPNPHSATAQFFINVKDNPFLNHKARTDDGYGYCVFGKVIEGMDVVDKIKATPTGVKGRFQNVPVETVTIQSVKRAP